MSDDDRTQHVTAWSRAAPDQPWQPTTGFGADAFESLGDVRHLGDRWVLWGRHAGDTAHPTQAMRWTSTDGVGWSRAEGDFGDGDRSSGIGEVCLDPTGRAVAVGWIHLTESNSTATGWIEQDGRWQRTTLPTGPDVASSFSNCSTVGGRLVITGDLDGTTGRWTIDATGAFQPVDPPVVDAPTTPRGDATEPFQLGEGAAVPGGYLTTGRLDTVEYTGRVLWLTADGTRWTWLPVPVVEPGGSLMVHVDGDDVTVLSSSTNVSQAWRIPDIASVIASIPTG